MVGSEHKAQPGDLIMCEPYFSTNQFMVDQRAKITIGPALLDATEIRGYYHFAKFGFGHSESLNKVLNNQQLPNVLQYETAWWNRSHQFDSYLFRFDRDMRRCYGVHNDNPAFVASEIYANRACIGDLPTLRRFLEAALAKTHAWNSFYNAFTEMLSDKGRSHLVRCHKKYNISNYQHPRLINLMIGLTRKREMLVTEWADDDKLWQKKETPTQLAV
jgi:hypothetical protein